MNFKLHSINTQLEKRWLQTIDEVAKGRCMDAEVVFVIVLTYCAMIFNYFIFSEGPELKLDNPLTIAEELALRTPRQMTSQAAEEEQSADFTMCI